MAVVTTVAAGLASQALQAQTTTAPASAAGAAPSTNPAAVPWYRRTHRWGQTNITEIDAIRYDIPWWREYWKRTEVQGVIINAGGIFAYYPSAIPLHYQPPQLGGRDLYGELAKAAHDDGLAVLARMDSSKVHEPLYQAHPDWFCVDATGQPYRTDGLYLSCVNSAYYDEYLPSIMREIITRSSPQGFADNIWHGMDRTSICYCQNCAKSFKDKTGQNLPQARDWNSAAYRQWIQWSYARRTELWDNNNKVTRGAGGADCLWIGMNGAGVSGQASSFRDWKEICDRSELVLLDNQSRSPMSEFHENAEAGKLIHGILGWDKLVPESMAMYQHGRPQFRLSTKPPAEARMWMAAGIAGGISPWWHHVGAFDEDRRIYQTAEPVMTWHKTNEQYLFNRQPVASVGIVWSQRNVDYFGRDNADDLVDQPWKGFAQAMVRGRIPYLPVHIDQVDSIGAQFSVLILANLGAMSDAQIDAIRRFVNRGGALVASGQTSLYNEWGDARADFALADLLGVSGGHATPTAGGGRGLRAAAAGGAGVGGAPARHTYLRLTPEIAAAAYGPKLPNAQPPAIGDFRHATLAGFDATDILPYGGTLSALTVAAAAQTLITFIPEMPSTPPEIAYMHTERTNIPALVVNESAAGRVAYLAADIDRRYAIDNLPDHGNLLGNIVRWAAGESLPVQVDGPGLVNCELYHQPGRLILHVVNLTSAGTWRAPMEELIPIGPLYVKVKIDREAGIKSGRALVAEAGGPISVAVDGGWASFELKSVLDHEVVVLE
jgi:hypothetical protein